MRIVDGDTLVVLDAANTQTKIRLAGIDCPERKQPFGQRAKQALSDYVFNQQVTVEWTNPSLSPHPAVSHVFNGLRFSDGDVGHYICEHSALGSMRVFSVFPGRWGRPRAL